MRRRPITRTRQAGRTVLGAALAACMLATISVVLSPAAAGGERRLRSWYGRVVKVRDGDTVAVDITGDGTSTPVVIRTTGIQAMALAHGSSTGQDECHAREATARLSQLTLGKKVRTQSYFTLIDTHGRYNRYVDVYNPATGKYDVDVQRILLREGHALWLAQQPENARLFRYHTYAEQGMAAGRNLYDKDYCRSGPAQSARLRMSIHWDAAGDDTKNLNGEWVRIENTGTTKLPLAAFYLRKAKRSVNKHFSSARVLRPGGTLTVHSGSGTATANHVYWGSSKPLWNNLEGPGEDGSAVYLYDGHGDIRAHDIYQCTYRC